MQPHEALSCFSNQPANSLIECEGDSGPNRQSNLSKDTSPGVNPAFATYQLGTLGKLRLLSKTRSSHPENVFK